MLTPCWPSAGPTGGRGVGGARRNLQLDLGLYLLGHRFLLKNSLAITSTARNRTSIFQKTTRGAPNTQAVNSGPNSSGQSQDSDDGRDQGPAEKGHEAHGEGRRHGQQRQHGAEPARRAGAREVDAGLVLPAA